MNNLLKPERLAVDPNSPTAAKEWRFWHQTFKNFLTLCGNDAPDKYLTIINLMSHSVYDYVEDCTDVQKSTAYTWLDCCCFNAAQIVLTPPAPRNGGPFLPFFGQAGQVDPLVGWRSCY